MFRTQISHITYMAETYRTTRKCNNQCPFDNSSVITNKDEYLKRIQIAFLCFISNVTIVLGVIHRNIFLLFVILSACTISHLVIICPFRCGNSGQVTRAGVSAHHEVNQGQDGGTTGDRNQFGDGGESAVNEKSPVNQRERIPRSQGMGFSVERVALSASNADMLLCGDLEYIGSTLGRAHVSFIWKVTGQLARVDVSMLTLLFTLLPLCEMKNGHGIQP